MPTSLTGSHRVGGGGWQRLPLLPEVRAVLFGQLYRAGSELWGGSQWSVSIGPMWESPGGRVSTENILSCLLRPQMWDHCVLSGPLQDICF